MKIIKNWFKSIILAFLGGGVFFYSIVAPIELFIEMMNSTGKEFVSNFICFIICMLFFIFAPIIYFYILQDKTKEKETEKD